MGSLPTLQLVIDPSSSRFSSRKIPVTLLSLFLDDYFKVKLKAVKITSHTLQSVRTKRVFLKLEILMLCFKRASAQFRLIYEHDTKAYVTGSKTPFIRTLWQYMELNDFLNGLAALTARKALRIQLGREQVTPQT
jgi:hypothetical protein